MYATETSDYISDCFSFFSVVAPDDYTAILSAQLVFPLNSVDGDMQCVEVTIVDDGCLEPSENFTVSLSNLVSPGLASIGTPSSAVVNLADSTGTKEQSSASDMQIHVCR